MDLEKVSNLIKTKRKEKGLTQEELAQKLNVTEKAISRWETGRGTPDISLLIPLSKELGVSTSEILEGKENSKENIEKIIDYININRKTKNIKSLIISMIIYIITLIFYLSYLKIEYDKTSTFEFSYKGEIIVNLFFAVCIIISNKIIANYYYDKIKDKEKMKKISYITVLVLYIIMIFNIVMFTRNIGENTYNLIPFRTISEYIINYQNYNFYIIRNNIIGNIVMYMPVQYLIIKIFDIKKFKNVFIIDSIFLLIIELSQLLTHTGMFDIDDIILNLLGMIIMYIFLMIFRKFKNKK